jgi:HEAT repeat protein
MRRRIDRPPFRFPFRVHRSAFIACFLAFLFSLSICVAFGNAQEKPKQKLQEWQIDGILAALDDGYSGVKQKAFEKLGEFDAEDLKAFPKQSEEIGKRAIDILNNRQEDSSLRSRAAEALGRVGKTNDAAVQVLTAILNNRQEASSLRISVIVVLGNLGKTHDMMVPVLADILKNSKESSYTRSKAAEALGNLGKTYDRAVQVLINFLNNREEVPLLRGSAAVALGNLGKTHDRVVQVLADFLKNREEVFEVRSSAAVALGNLGKTHDRALQILTDFLNNRQEAPSLRSKVASVLGNLGKTHDRVVEVLTDIFNNSKETRALRSSAAVALGNLGKTHDSVVPVLVEILKNEEEPSYTRSRAAEALGHVGKTNDTAVQGLTAILNNRQEAADVRSSAVEALGRVGKTNDTAVQVLTNVLKNSQEASSLRSIATVAVGNRIPLLVSDVFIFIERTYDRSSSDFNDMRFAAYFYGRGNSEIKTLLKWIGSPKRESIPTQLNHDEAKKTLEVFAKAWEPSREFPNSRAELAGAIAEVAKMVRWQTGDMPLLEQHYKNLSDAKSKSADSVKAALDSLTVWKYVNQFRNIVATHLTFWVALIFAYPQSPQVQAIFFWNPWVRKIGGAGYVGFLLAWVPFLRRKLFEPFRDSLLADAKLHSFNPDAYFPDSAVTLKDTNQPQPLPTVFPEIKGQSILEGDSGLGKTLFLRHLVKASQRIVVYLPAEKCEKGVIEAIQAKLHGQAQDADFLRTLIYSGAIDICIDGLNEVSADTRATISDFVERYFKGNILMTTQPIEWSPPSTAKTYVLQPLRPDQIQSFLVLRQAVLPVSATYVQDCDRYLQSALSPNQSSEERIAAQRILSNPMDLTIVAQMLAQGRTPDLFRLQEQQYNLMASEYRQIYSSEFPLKSFSEAIYQHRLNDEPALPADEFYNELICMEDDKHKMVISRQWKDPKGEIQKEWYFRHDKIAEFFIVQTFLGDSETAKSRMYEHLGDPRFRGVYFLLATFLSIDAAQALRETLIQYAADTKDHTVSDTFVQLLRTRKA